jgi:hypothetical protein
LVWRYLKFKFEYHSFNQNPKIFFFFSAQPKINPAQNSLAARLFFSFSQNFSLPARVIRPFGPAWPTRGCLPHPTEPPLLGLPPLHTPPSIALRHPVGVEPNRRPTPFISPSSNGHPLASSPVTGTLMKHRWLFPLPHRLPSPLSPLRPYKRCHHLSHFPHSVLPHLAPLIHAPSRPTPSTDAMFHSSPPPAQPRHRAARFWPR